jgi:hypothetical protein
MANLKFSEIPSSFYEGCIIYNYFIVTDFDPQKYEFLLEKPVSKT